MLGKIAPGWLWAACGKHPTASDFFQVGPTFPLIKRFSEWIDRGYQDMINKNKDDIQSAPVSWRFWARGAEKNGLAVGLMRDSSDRLGRPFPLLIMGTGPLDQWEEYWDLLPLACEGAWERMEYLSSQKLQDVGEIQAQVQKIRPPLPRWDELKVSRGEMNPAPDFETKLRDETMNFSEKKEVVLRLNQIPLDDTFDRVILLHFLFKKESKIVPNALFVGGTLEGPFLIVYARPLTAGDFFQLWSFSSERRKNGSRVSG
jgi:type VI secretion system protein VasJ